MSSGRMIELRGDLRTIEAGQGSRGRGRWIVGAVDLLGGLLVPAFLRTRCGPGLADHKKTSEEAPGFIRGRNRVRPWRDSCTSPSYDVSGTTLGKVDAGLAGEGPAGKAWPPRKHESLRHSLREPQLSQRRLQLGRTRMVSGGLMSGPLKPCLVSRRRLLASRRVYATVPDWKPESTVVGGSRRRLC